MAQKYPRDRFDEIPDDLYRVGAHRAPRGKGRGWIAVGWAALATVLLVAAGIFALSQVNGANSFHSTAGAAAPTAPATHTPTPTPTPTIVPTVNPALKVNVLNGTTTSGLGTKVGTKLKAAGWKIGTIGNASKQNVTSTVVYYSSPADQAAALGAVQSLPGASAQLTQDYANTGADLTVVVGSDYKG